MSAASERCRDRTSTGIGSLSVLVTVPVPVPVPADAGVGGSGSAAGTMDAAASSQRCSFKGISLTLGTVPVLITFTSALIRIVELSSVAVVSYEYRSGSGHTTGPNLLPLTQPSSDTVGTRCSSELGAGVSVTTLSPPQTCTSDSPTASCRTTVGMPCSSELGAGRLAAAVAAASAIARASTRGRGERAMAWRRAQD